jgi:hypothetical protein
VMLVVSAKAFQPHLRVTPFARGLPREAVSVLTTLGGEVCLAGEGNLSSLFLAD